MNRKLIRPDLTDVKEQLHSASKPYRVRKPVPPEQTNAESFYYKKQMDNKTRMVVKLKDGRYLLVLMPSSAIALRQQLADVLVPVAAHAWRWLDIRNGVPLVTAATQDQLVPQMANFELLGGVSFNKGCYTGQEVVARMQHLGKLKRRMFLANVAAQAKAGDPLYSEDLGDQTGGIVVNAEASPDGGYDLLAVVQTASREASTVHLKSLGGPVLRFLPLPYALG